MLRLPLPLFGQILVWVGVNLVVAGAVVVWVMGGGMTWQGMAAGPLGERPAAVAGNVAAELGQTSPAGWTAVLERWGEAEGMQYTLHRPDGTQLAGREVALPAEVRAWVVMPGGGGRRGPGPADAGAPPGVRDRSPVESGAPRDVAPGVRGGAGGAAGGGGGGPPPMSGRERVFAVSAGGEVWVGVRIPLPGVGGEGPRRPGMLLARTASGWEAAAYFGLTRWVPVLGGLMLMSAVLWWPLVRGMTGTVRKVTEATEAIADGKLSTRVEVGGRDELTRLAAAVNVMAGRLERLVTEERRFMGDVAHELASPLARAQVGLELLERELGERGVRGEGSGVRGEGSGVRGEGSGVSRAGDGVREVERSTGCVPGVSSEGVVREDGVGRGGGAGGVGGTGGAGGAGGAGGGVMGRLGDVREEVEQMSALVGELLAFSRAAVGPRGREAMSEVEVLGLVRGSVGRERAEGVVAVRGEEAVVRAVPELLARAVGNLVRNAVRYAGGGEVEVRRLGGGVEIAVRDRGPGVPAEALSRLGDAFYRPDVARARETGGVGLGLAIVRTCVEACGGRVAFANREGGGFEARVVVGE